MSGYDQILGHLGSFGKWQRFIYALVCLVSLGNGFLVMQQSFILYTPDSRCLVPLCDGEAEPFDIPFKADHNAFTIPYWTADAEDLSDSEFESRSCRVFKTLEPNTATCSNDSFSASDTLVCNEHVYDNNGDIYGKSFVAQFDLGRCTELTDSWPFDPVITKPAFLGMAYMIGNLFGAVISGYLADIFGRVPVCLSAIAICSILSFSGSFAQDYWTWFFLRLFTGFASKGLFQVAFIISMEICGKDWRMLLGILINIPYAIGEMVVGLVAYLLPNWRDLQMTLAILLGLLLGLYFVLPESPRWLIATGRYKKAKKVLAKGADMNQRTIPRELLEPQFLHRSRSVQGKEKKPGLSALFKPSFMARNTVIMFVNWFVVTLCFYGLSLNSVNMSGNSYVNFVLSAATEIPAYIFVVLVMDGLGRKPLLVFCQLLSGLACIIGAFVDADTGMTVLSLFGKFGASAAFSIVYVYTAEMYPTGMRNTAVGACSSFARIGAVLAPIMANLSSNTLAMTIMGSSSLVGAILALFLPETLGLPFPESVEDVKNLSENPKPWYKWMNRKELKLKREEIGVTDEVRPSSINVPTIAVLPATPQVERKEVEPEIQVFTITEAANKEQPVDSSPVVSPSEPAQGMANEAFVAEPEVKAEEETAVTSEVVDIDKTPTPILEVTQSRNESEIIDPTKDPHVDPPLQESSAPAAPSTLLAPNTSVKSRKFSQMKPLPVDSPNAQHVGKFVMIPAE